MIARDIDVCKSYIYIYGKRPWNTSVIHMNVMFSRLLINTTSGIVVRDMNILFVAQCSF